MAQSDARDLLENAAFLSSERLLMLGFLVSNKTMNRIPNKWPGRYPAVVRSIAEMISSLGPRSLNLVHYNTDNKGELGAELLNVHQLIGGDLDGFQINAAWPEVVQLYTYVNDCQFVKPRIVLQIGGRAMEMKGRDPRLIAAAIDQYRLPGLEVVTDVLIDPSGGLGRPFDPVFARSCLSEIKDRHPECGIGVAGGLTAENVDDLVAPLLDEFSMLSIDSEGRLRTPQPDDALDMEKAQAYLTRSSEMFSSHL